MIGNRLGSLDDLPQEFSLNEEKIITDFIKKVITRSRDIEPEIAKTIYDNFWDLV